MPRKDVKDILRKHAAKIEGQIKTSNIENVNYSREYVKFKLEMAPDLTRYERWCKSLGSLVKLNVSVKDRERVEKHLEIAHLDIEPWQALTLSIMVFVSVFLIGLLSSLAFVFISGNFASFPFLFFLLMIFLALALYYFINNYPARLANKWRLKASSQMVPAILYVVVYMRHTSNLEKAIEFASEHLQYPLSLDFKKIFYNVQVGKFSTIKESLDNYLETWRDYSSEFIESFHLIESSLFEPDNSRRIATLEKALQIVLDGVHDKMLRFTHDVRSPLTNVYMLGVVLPTLGLALLPLASAMIGDYLKWYHVILLFNLIVPFFVYYLTDKIMMLRPGGYGETSLLERNPSYYKYKSKKPYIYAFLIVLPFLLIGLMPLIFQYTPVPQWLGLQRDMSFADVGLSIFGTEKLFDFKASGTGFVGPFGIGALILSLFIPLGLALFFSIAFKAKTKDLIKDRHNTRRLEKEFNSSLFQMGNRMGNGMPPELIFGKIAASTKGLATEDFFKRVNHNIRNNGMSVEKSIFDKKIGALIYFPSDLIATSMRIMIESAKKGLKVAALSLMSISEYVKNIQKINNRLKDMLAEIVSDMKSNMTFLAPLLSGVVVGLAAMIGTILNKLDLNALEGGSAATLGGFGSLMQIFDVTKMIPPYWLQLAVGIYIIQIIFILTGTLVSIDAGEDKLEKTYTTGKNLIRGVLLYFITALIGTIALFFLAAMVLGNF